jgi:hypothetical protein
MQIPCTYQIAQSSVEELKSAAHKKSAGVNRRFISAGSV